MGSRILIIAVIASLQTLFPAKLPAQDAVLEEIVVTARKRDESALEVPLAITAFSAEDIEAIGAKNLTDIAEFSPGLFFSGMGNSLAGRVETVIRFRGMDTNSTDVQSQLSSLFVDGVYVSGGTLGLGLEDVERVEVIKGPQSAFFGRSTFSGAINYVTRNPGNDWRGNVSAEFGRFDYKEFTASIEGPLVTDKAAFRLTGRFYDTDGQYVNFANPGERLGAEETKSLAGTLYLTPSDQFSAKLRVLYYEDDDGAPLQGTFLSTEHNCMPGPPDNPAGTSTYFCGTLPEPRPDQIGLDSRLSPEAINALVRGINPSSGEPFPAWDSAFIEGFGLERRALRTSLSLDYEFANGMTLSSITGFNDEELNTLLDNDRSPSTTVFWNSFAESYLQDFSQEIRLASNQDQRLRWLVGANYFKLENESSSRIFWSPFGFLQFSDNRPFHGEVETTGIFGAIAYDFTERLTLNVEGRVQEDEITRTAFQAEPIGDTFSNFLPRVILDYQLGDNKTLYATYGKGNRPGTFNAGLVGQPPEVLAEVERQTGAGISVDEEELDNFEIGLKGRFLDGRAQGSISLYKMNWKNQHTRGQAVLPPANPGDPSIFIDTTTAIGETDLQGIELEAAFQASENLLLQGTFNLADSEFEVFECGFCDDVTGETNVAGNQSPRIPDTSATFSATWDANLFDDWSWFTRGDVIYTSSTYTEAFNLAQTDDFTRVNLRGGVRKDNIRVEAYVRNLFDERVITGAARTTDLFNFSAEMIAVEIPRRRTWGIKVDYRF